MPPTRRRKRGLLALTVVALAVALAAAGLAPAKRDVDAQGTSVLIKNRLCETTRGGKFVALPGFPGERIDRRLVADFRFIKRRWPIFVTDGFSRSGVHATNGEHPLGLALDIVPNFAKGGNWRDITALAKWAEPKQNQPRTPFRWVGYNGDINHGRGNHLHLSWSHNYRTKPYRPARVVYSRICPNPVDDGKPAGGGGGGGGAGAGSGSGAGGGISGRLGAAGSGVRLAPPVPEPFE